MKNIKIESKIKLSDHAGMTKDGCYTKVKYSYIDKEISDTNRAYANIQYVGDLTSYSDDKLIKMIIESLILAECESCGELYDYADEPIEVKQGGTHICKTCWNIEE